MYESRISSGRPGHLTPTGSFTVLEKDQSHFSTLYGVMKDASGKVIDWNADSDMPVPDGGKFVPAPMEYFLRFDGANGLHVGILPGYAASHGCVRLPRSKSDPVFNTAVVGTPVHIFGTPPPPPRAKLWRRLRPQGSPSPTPRRWPGGSGSRGSRKLHSRLDAGGRRGREINHSPHSQNRLTRRGQDAFFGCGR